MEARAAPGGEGEVLAVCAWCGKELAGRSSDPDPSVTTHGICDECFLGLRVKETVKRLQDGNGPFHLFIPLEREDLMLSVWREAPTGTHLIFHPDRRAGRERRNKRIGVPSDRRVGRDRRSSNLSFIATRRRPK